MILSLQPSLSTAWNKAVANIQGMISSTIVRIPDIILAVIIFIVFWLVGSSIKSLVKRLTRHYRHARNLGIVLGRLAQGTVILYLLLISIADNSSRGR